MLDPIHINDPIYLEEICITRGDTEARDGEVRNLYLQKYDDDTHYSVVDECGTVVPGVSFSGDANTADGIQRLHDLFDLVYGEDE
jgi:hypothetical protein